MDGLQNEMMEAFRRHDSGRFAALWLKKREGNPGYGMKLQVD